MIVKTRKSFLKDIEKLTNKKLRNQIADCMEEMISANKPSDLTNCKKMKSAKNAYRIRIGDYRLGFYYENNIVELTRFLHRSTVYNYFPE